MLTSITLKWQFLDQRSQSIILSIIWINCIRGFNLWNIVNIIMIYSQISILNVSGKSIVLMNWPLIYIHICIWESLHVLLFHQTILTNWFLALLRCSESRILTLLDNTLQMTNPFFYFLSDEIVLFAILSGFISIKLCILEMRVLLWTHFLLIIFRLFHLHFIIISVFLTGFSEIKPTV